MLMAEFTAQGSVDLIADFRNFFNENFPCENFIEHLYEGGKINSQYLACGCRELDNHKCVRLVSECKLIIKVYTESNYPHFP